MTVSRPTLISDRPIESPSEDALGYWPFARALAEGIINKSSKQGFVVGVQAKWGMGKTSAVNLMSHAIDELETGLLVNQKTKTEHFNPWQFASTEALTKSYLAVLGRLIALSLNEDVLRKKSGRFKKWIGGSKDVVGHTAAISAVAATGGLAIPFMGAIQGGVSSALGLSEEIIGSDELDDLADRIREALGNLEHRIVLILDDLDRLDPDDLAEVLTIIKTFGDLPNVVHVLLYDREIIDQSLTTKFGENLNPPYLQKIVQAEYDLPPPSASGLSSLADKLISPIFEGTEITETYLDVWRVGFRNYLLSPRDIVKLYNALSVTWPSVQTDAYAPDMIAIEMFRLFDRPLHQLLLASRHILLGLELDYGEKRIGELAEKLKGGRQTGVLRLISGMFPRLQKALPSPVGGRPTSISQGRPIGSEAGFDLYFRMTPSSEAVSVSLVEQLEAQIADADFVEKSFEEAGARAEIRYMGAFLDEFLNVLDDAQEIEFGTLEGFVRGAGISLSERFESQRRFTLFSSSQKISIACTKILSRIDRDGLHEKLKSLFRDGKSDLTVCAFVLAKVGEQYATIYSERRNDLDFSWSQEEVNELVDILAKPLSGLLEDGLIFLMPSLWMLLKVISESSIDIDIPPILNERAQKAEIARRIAFSAMNIQSEGEYGLELSMDRMPPREIYDLGTLVSIVQSHLTESAYSQNDARNLERFVSAGLMLLDGKQPDRFG